MVYFRCYAEGEAVTVGRLDSRMVALKDKFKMEDLLGLKIEMPTIANVAV